MQHQLTAEDRGALTAFLERVRERMGHPPSTAVVYGSKARGEAQAESDLDVLLVLDRDDHAVRRDVFDLAFEVFLETGVLISPLVLSRERLGRLRRSGRRIIQEIDRDGVMV